MPTWISQARARSLLADPISFWATTICRWARSLEASPCLLALELAEAFRRTASPLLDDELPQVRHGEKRQQRRLQWFQPGHVATADR